MTRRAYKLAALIGLLVLVALTASAVTARTPSRSEMPEYVTSQACLGCHVDEYLMWENSLHQTSFVKLTGPASYPADPSLAPDDLKAELEKADFMWHGQRFLLQDPVTGEFKYLNVTWNKATQAYEAYNGNRFWSTTSCGGCHSGAVNSATHYTQVQPGIGCESCHGPGRDHILGRGDISKIVATTDASASCAQCHSGFNQAPNSVRWAVGYRPGTKLEEFSGFVAQVFDPAAPPPVKTSTYHLQQYPQWKASKHATAQFDYLWGRGETRERCWNCHSTAVGLVEYGDKFDYTKHAKNDGVTCVACHAPHGSEFTASLRMEPQALCVSCHNVGTSETTLIGLVRAPHAPQADMLQGTGAHNVAPTTGAHTGITCIECHMTEGNHMMKVIKPGDVLGTARVDSCTKCHTNSSADSRGIYMDLWKQAVETRMAALTADVEKIEAALKANPNALSAEAKTQFEKARANYWYVKKDNSKGAHNFEYTIKILVSAQNDMTKVRAVLK